MKIEKQIKQKQFKNKIEKTIANIAFTHSYFSSKINTVLKTHNISSPQFSVLRIIKGQHPRPVSIGDITSRMIDKMSNTSRLIKKLEEKGLVQRINSPFDGRQVDIFLTFRGCQILNKLNNLVEAAIAENKYISDEDLTKLNLLLDRLRSG